MFLLLLRYFMHFLLSQLLLLQLKHLSLLMQLLLLLLQRLLKHQLHVLPLFQLDLHANDGTLVRPVF